MINSQAHLVPEAWRPNILPTKPQIRWAFLRFFRPWKKTRKKPWQNAMLLLDSLGVVPGYETQHWIRLAVWNCFWRSQVRFELFVWIVSLGPVDVYFSMFFVELPPDFSSWTLRMELANIWMTGDSQFFFDIDPAHLASLRWAWHIGHMFGYLDSR